MNLNDLKKPKSKGILSEESGRKEKMTEQVFVGLKPSEKIKLEKAAVDAGLKTSPFIRSLLKKNDYI